MPSKSVKKTSTPVETVTPPAPVVETAPVVAVVETAPVVAATPKQKGGKKAVAATPVVEAAPVAATPVVEAAPVVETKAPVKKGGAKSKAVATSEAVTPVVAAEPVVETKKRAPRAPKAAKPVQEAGAATEQTAGAPKVKAPRKAAVPKKPVVETENDESTDRRIRSFKVKLPDKEEFEGRFTGLTPYQAANKALSKYFRETEKPKQEITFLICESTRKSKKSVYTYIGKRYQLEVPVKYTIQDGREIVKNFKNSLKKVKKVDLLDQAAGAVAPVVSA
jgi:hypothetical protein